MSLTLDISEDFVNIVDNTESATVKMDRPDGIVQVAITDALESTTKRDRQLIEGLSVGGGSFQIWCIPDTQLNPSGNGRYITENDQILLSGRPTVQLIVMNAEARSLGRSTSYWWCVCRERRV